VSRALLVAGTTSDAGKTVVTAGICRFLTRQGLRVAPFKAQNMSLNSTVTADGAEISRAQAMQAAAAGVPPEAAMNPVLLKPGSDGTSQLVVLGRAVGEVHALSYAEHRGRLLATVLDCLADLRRRFDVVVCEGAGSPSEVNLRDGDITNMGLASAAGLPVVVVGDIDRGGVFAGLFGTLALLSTADQQHIRRRRRHRPGRRVRRPVRDARPAQHRRPAAHPGLPDQQVPGGLPAAGPRPAAAGTPHRPAGARRPAVAARARPGRRGLPEPRRRCAPRHHSRRAPLPR